MDITINGKQYKVKYTIRALFIFEQITGKPFEIKTLLDNYIFFYSMILANNPDNVLDWDEFLDALDGDKELLSQLTKLVDDYQKKDSIFEQVDTTSGEKKKLSVSELYALLTLRLHYPPNYVMDEMEMYEIRAVMDYEYLAHKDSWEQARLVAYLVAQSNSSKRINITDIAKFYWEKEEEAGSGNTTISNDDISRLKEKANQYKQLLKL